MEVTGEGWWNSLITLNSSWSCHTEASFYIFTWMSNNKISVLTLISSTVAMTTLFRVPAAKKFLDHSYGEKLTQHTSSSPKLTVWNDLDNEPIMRTVIALDNLTGRISKQFQFKCSAAVDSKSRGCYLPNLRSTLRLRMRRGFYWLLGKCHLWLSNQQRSYAFPATVFVLVFLG